MNTIEATKPWVATQLGQGYTQFAQRWRDSAGAAWITLEVNGEPLGHLLPHIAQATVTACKELSIGLFQAENSINLSAPSEHLPDTFESLAYALRALNLVPLWRDEKQTLYDGLGHRLVDIERGLFKTLGLQSRAVHMHAESPNGHVWVSRRSVTKAENPNMLDNLSAGGIGAGESHTSCATREMWEEAGIKPEDIQARYDAPLSLWVNRPLAKGWHNELIFIITLRLNAEVIPVNQDGEANAFYLMQKSACQRAINDWRFTPDAGLITALAMTDQSPLLPNDRL